MALSTATIAYDVSDMVGTDFDIRRTKVWASTTVADDTVIDTVGNAIRIGTGAGTLAADGTGSIVVWIPGTGSNPDSWQNYVHVDYADPMDRTRKRRTFGPFTVTTSANLADLVEEQEVPAEYLTTITAALQDLVDDAEASLQDLVDDAEASEVAAEAAEAAAEAAQAAAEAARDDAIDISGIATPDAVVEALLNNPASDTAIALAASYVRQSISPINPFNAPFLTVGDGVADDTVALQAAFDAGLDENRSVYLPTWAKFKTTNTLHLGPTTGFGGVVVFSDGASYREGMTGATIIATATDRPAVNIRGGRRTKLVGVTILGTLDEWIEDNDLAQPPVSLGGTLPVLDDLDGDNWVDPGADADSDSRYAPHAGITIDGFAGTAPAGRYPVGAGPYGCAPSTDTTIEDVFIRGFNTGFVDQPSDFDGNGDYIKLNNIWIEFCKYGMSFGNNQNRNPDIRNVVFNRCWTTMTNHVHGKQVGRLGGNIDNIGPMNCIYLFDLEQGNTTPTTFSHVNAETTWSIGKLGSGTSVPGTLIFQSCQLNMSMGAHDTRGVPAWYIETYGDSAPTIQFRGCLVTGFYRVFAVQSNYFEALDGTEFYPDDMRAVSSVPGSSVVRRFAYNALAGGLVFPQGAPRRPQAMRFRPAHLGTGVLTSAAADADSYHLTGRNYCIPAVIKGGVIENRPAMQVGPTVPPEAIDKGGSPGTLTDRELTFTLPGWWDEWTFAQGGPLPGDVLVDQTTGSTFYVTARTGFDVTAELVNNFRTDDGGTTYDTIVPYDVDTGALYIVVGRYYSPSYPIKGTFATGSAVITNVQTADFVSSFLEADIAVDDWLYLDQKVDRFMSPSSSGPKVTARSNAGSTITVSTNPAIAQTRSIPLLVRKAADNE